MNFGFVSTKTASVQYEDKPVVVKKHNTPLYQILMIIVFIITAILAASSPF